jgi:hypothetical protein
MFRPTLLFSALALALLVGAAPEVDQNDPRYKLTPAEDGTFLRLDTQTGATSVCRRKDGRWVCETAADDRRALETEIDRLATENTELKGAVKRLEELLKLPDADAPSTKRGALKLRLPTEQEVDRAMGYVEGIVGKFKERWQRYRDRNRQEYSERWDYRDRWDYHDYRDYRGRRRDY